MANSAPVKPWFDATLYMANKLIQMQKADPNTVWTADSLQAAFEAAGFYGDTGAQAHFNKYGHKEDVSPNKLFDAKYYYEAKALQWYQTAQGGSIDKQTILDNLEEYGKKMEAIIKGVGLDAWTHYIKYGTKEGINPSNDFDTTDYMNAKIAAMAGKMSADQVYAAFAKAGFNALSHEQTYAGSGKAYEVVATSFPVPEDEKLPETGGDGVQLTVGIDNLSGTHFVANPVVNSLGDVKQTLNTNDTLKGTGDDNSLDVLWSGGTDNGENMNAQNIVTPNMTNIQTLNMSNVGGGPLVINGNNVQGLTTITNTDSIRNFTVQNLAQAVENVSIKGTATDTTVQMQPTAMTGTEDALNLTVEDLRTGSSFTTSNGYETLNVTTQNAASVMDKIVSGGVKTATFAGDQDLTLRGQEGNAAVAPLSDTIAKIDASAMTGKMVLGSVGVNGFAGSFTSTAAKVEITTGSADDTLVIGDLDKDYTIDAGEGTDLLVVTGATGTAEDPNSVNTAPVIKGVEKLKVVSGDDTGVDQDVTLELKGVEGLQELILGAMGDETKVVALKNMTHNPDNNFTITAVGDGTTDPQTFNGVTYSPFGTVADDAKLIMNISNQGKDAAITTGTLNFGKVENVAMNVADVAHTENFNVDIDTALETFNFTVDDGATVDLGVLGINGSLKALTLDSAATTTEATISQMGGGLATLHGSSDFNLTFTQADNRGMTVDSSDATGLVTLTAGAANVALAGGAGSQLLVGAATGPNTFRGGEGADTLSNTDAATFGNIIQYNAGTESNIGSLDILENFTFDAGGLAGGATDVIEVRGLTGALDVTNIAAQATQLRVSQMTIANLNALVNSTDGTLNTLAGGGNASALVLTSADATVRSLLMVDIDGDGNFEGSDLLVDITGCTNTAIDADNIVVPA